MQASPRAGRWWWSALLAVLAVGCWWPSGAEARHEGPPDRALALRVRFNDRLGGLLYLPAEARGHGARSTMILLGDAIGQDGRTRLYAERLLSAGFAVLDADFDETSGDGAGPGLETVPPAHRLPLALAALRGVPEADARRTGVLGFGEGGRAVLSSPPGTLDALAAAVLVYPWCDAALIADAARHGGVARGGHPPILLAHGDADASETPGCAAVEAALGGSAGGASRLVVHGAGYGWDAEPAAGRRIMLQDPACPTRHREAHPDPARAQLALERMMVFLFRWMAPPSP